MAAEDWVPLLRGAFRLESRMKACTSGDSGTGLTLVFELDAAVRAVPQGGLVAGESQWIKQINYS